MDLAVQIAQIVGALGLVAAVFGLRQVQRQRIRAFEDFYVRRYWKLMDELSLPAITGPRRRVPASDERALRSSIALCEDELDPRAEGWISDATWGIWSTGIQAQFRRPVLAQVWRRVRAEAEGGGGQPLERLRRFEVDGKDPCTMGWLRKRWRGLHGLFVV